MNREQLDRWTASHLRREHARLASVARRWVGASRADDMIQDACVRTWRALGRITRAEPDAPWRVDGALTLADFLSRAVRDASRELARKEEARALATRRKTTRDPGALDWLAPDATADPEDELVSALDLERFAAHLQSRDRALSTTFHALRTHEGDLDACADMLGVSTRTVRTRRHLLRQRYLRFTRAGSPIALATSRRRAPCRRRTLLSLLGSTPWDSYLRSSNTRTAANAVGTSSAAS